MAVHHSQKPIPSIVSAVPVVGGGGQRESIFEEWDSSGLLDFIVCEIRSTTTTTAVLQVFADGGEFL